MKKNTVKTGKLREPYMGYKINAEVIWVGDEKRFLLLRDTDDEFWGYGFHTDIIPKIFDETKCLRIRSEERFWTAFNCIAKKWLKLPANFEEL